MKINATLLTQLDARVTMRRAGSEDTIGTRFAEEQRVLRTVDVAFVAEAVTVATISPRALAHVEGAYYSVPSVGGDGPSGRREKLVPWPACR